MVNKLHTWVSARLWRRLMVSNLAVILGGYMVLQVALAGFLALTNEAFITENDAGLAARSFAQTAGWLAAHDQTAQFPLIFDMALQESVILPLPDLSEAWVEIQQEPPSLPEGWGKRVNCITILDASGSILAQVEPGICHAQQLEGWDTVISLAQSGESNPDLLSKRVSWDQQTILLGAAGIPDETGATLGAAVVEMTPDTLPNASSQPIDALLNFAFIILVSSLFLGLPGLVIALGLAFFSGLITSRKLVHRLNDLEETAQVMAGGDLSQRVPDTSPDEIGQVGLAFNQLAVQLQQTLSDLEAEKERVESLLRARRDMVAGVSHDLRTPIATLSAYLETLAAHPERLADYLTILNAETIRLSRLVDDLFELARLDARELSLTLCAVDLAGVIQKVVSVYKPVAWAQQRVVLNAEIVNALPPVHADVQRVEQILVNLVVNALRHTPEGGIITIEAEAKAQVVEVRVVDTGSGISAEDLPHIFERFYRGDPARTRAENNGEIGSRSGLGLAIVKGLLTNMGGTITAVSEPDEGTCICFSLPIEA